MNAILLVLLLLPLLALGYRYFGKFLSLLLGAATEEGRPGAGRLWGLFLQRFAVLAGGTTLLGAALAGGWGWAPAFLWIASGGLLGGAVYAMVVLRAGGGAGLPPAPLAAWAGPAGLRVFRALALITLLALGWLLATLIGRLLQDQPSLVLPFWSELLLAAVLAGLARRAAAATWLLAPLLALALLAWPLVLDTPLALAGGLEVAAGGTVLLRLDGALAWGLLAACGAALAAGRSRAAALQAVMAGGLGAVLVLAVLAAAAVALPPLAAPRYHDAAQAPVLPWLFLVLAGGAFGGVQGLLARESLGGLAGAPARLLGFGVALADMLLALAALLLVTAGFPDGIAWAAAYGDWAPLSDPFSALPPLRAGAAGLLAALGVTAGLAHHAVGLVLASLALAGLVAVLGALQSLLADMLPGGLATPLRLRWWTASAVMGVVLLAAQGWLGTAPWQALLGFQQAVGLALLAAGLAWLAAGWRRAAWLSPAAVLVAVALHWALGWQLVAGWQGGRADLLAPALALLALEAALVAAVGWHRRRRPPA